MKLLILAVVSLSIAVNAKVRVGLVCGGQTGGMEGRIGETEEMRRKVERMEI